MEHQLLMKFIIKELNFYTQIKSIFSIPTKFSTEPAVDTETFLSASKLFPFRKFENGFLLPKASLLKLPAYIFMPNETNYSIRILKSLPSDMYGKWKISSPARVVFPVLRNQLSRLPYISINSLREHNTQSIIAQLSRWYEIFRLWKWQLYLSLLSSVYDHRHISLDKCKLLLNISSVSV